LRARVEGVTAEARRLPHPPILIGHGAGAIVALDAARSGAASAAVLVAPLVPGSAPVGVLTRRWDAVAASLLGRAIPPPRGAGARRVFGESPEGLDVEPARAVFDVVRGRLRTFRPLHWATLVVGGGGSSGRAVAAGCGGRAGGGAGRGACGERGRCTLADPRSRLAADRRRRAPLAGAAPRRAAPRALRRDDGRARRGRNRRRVTRPAASGDVEIALRDLAQQHVVGRLVRLARGQPLESLADLLACPRNALALEGLPR